MATRDFIGRGWAFPFRFDAVSGGVAKDVGSGQAQEFSRVRWSVWNIISTKKGELFMQRGFGAAVRDLMFQPDTSNFAEKFDFSVQLGLEDEAYGEHRAFYDSATPTLDRNTGVASIDIEMTLRSRNVSENLVFPFYVAGGERAAAEENIPQS